MKKVNMKIALLGLLFTLGLVFAGTNVAVAQSSSFTEGMYTIPQGNFVEKGVAKELLLAEITILKQQLETQIPGSGPYRNSEFKLAYYKGIDNALDTGSSVAESIIVGMGVFETDLYGDITRAKKIELKETAIELLSL